MLQPHTPGMRCGAASTSTSRSTSSSRASTALPAAASAPLRQNRHHQSSSSMRRAAVVAGASKQQDAAAVRDELRKRASDQVRLRSEAEAPWRSLRLTLYGFSVASAGMGSLICLPQLAGALGGAPGALPVSQVLENVAVNLGAVGVFGFLFSRDWAARDKQMARLRREEQLAGQPVQLATGKRLRLGDLQGSSRVVLVAGTPQQVAAAVAAAEPYKEQLVRRGVLVVPLPIFGSSSSGSGGSEGGSSDGSSSSSSSSSSSGAVLPPTAKEDVRWRVTALNLDGWREWFNDQLALTQKANADQGLYIGLRLDGRTRASGMGPPPWARFVGELAPLEGDDKWTGFFDGFDGSV